MKRLIAFVLLLSALAGAQNGSPDVKSFFMNYVRAYSIGRYDQAVEYWSLYDRTNTDRLQIRYADVPVKLEAGSLLSRYAEQLKLGAATLTIDTTIKSRDFTQVRYHIKLPDSTVEGVHYLVTGATTDATFLTSAYRVFTEAWDGANSRFIELRYRDKTLLEPSTMEQADNFVERTANRLGISEAKYRALEQHKIQIALSAAFTEVSQLTGRTSFGELVKANDAIVSKYFPPYMEIARFLVAYANDSLPLYTHPFFEYGTATFLGGRWGRSADVMVSLGSYLYNSNMDFIKLEDLFTVDGFHSYDNNPDFSFAPAALFCKYLFEKLGRDAYFQLYRQFSGSEHVVREINAGKFREKISAAIGMPWIEIEKEFRDLSRIDNYAGIAPGSLDNGDLVYESGAQSINIRVLEDSTHYNFLVRYRGAEPKAALMLKTLGSASPYRSFLFKEYFPDTTYAQERFALIFTPHEIGTYDFFANEITGKYILGVTGERTFITAGSPEYRFRIEKRLLPDFKSFTKSIVFRK